MKLILSHPTGNANVRAAALGLARAGLLSEFHTTIASFPGSYLDRIAGFGPLSEFRRREFDTALRSLTFMHPMKEMGRMVSSKFGLKSLTRRESGLFSIDAVCNHLDKQVASVLRKCRSQMDGIYAYEDAALMSFKQAKIKGIKTLYDLPIGYWRSSKMILENERNIWPEWSSTLGGLEDSPEKLMRKDEELSLADKIFVASSFTAKTLNHFPGPLGQIEVIPYGFPPVLEHRDYNVSKNRLIKVLFVGGLSQRKGIANLFAAVDTLGKYVSLTVIGKKPQRDCPALNKALAKHKWISSLPHNDILKIMRENDILIFPSLFEGFGLVITEAMSQGTPVITTDRTCGPDLIKHEENGWIVEAGSVSHLKEAIENLIDKPEVIEKIGRAAMRTAANRPWQVYGHELSKSIAGINVKHNA